MNQHRLHPSIPTPCIPAGQPGPHLVLGPHVGVAAVSAWCILLYHPLFPNWGLLYEAPPWIPKGPRPRLPFQVFHPPSGSLWFQKYCKSLCLFGPTPHSPTGHHAMPVAPGGASLSLRCLAHLSQIPAILTSYTEVVKGSGEEAICELR